MKIQFLLYLILLSMSMNAQDSTFWNIDRKLKNKLNREDSTKWDLKNLQLDLDGFNKSKNKIGVFPSPKYNLISKNSFNGLGYGGEFEGLLLNDNIFIYNFFYINRNSINKCYIGNLKHDVFFIIIVLTDYIDQKSYKHMNPSMTSRNHPNYLAHGYFKTLNSLINYSAFINGDRLSFAIVNSRLFDLSLGKIVLIIPQKDKSLNSIQLELPRIPKDEIDNYLRKLLSSKEITSLYNK